MWAKNQTGLGLKQKKKKKKKKKKTEKRQRVTSRQKQPPIQKHSTPKHTVVRFVNKPLSKFDLMNWVQQLGIKHFTGIYSRDNLPYKILKKECGIINLDSQIGPGTHWVC